MILQTEAQRKRLADLAGQYARIEDEIKAAKDDQKAIAENAKAELGVPPKALKQAAKELGWDSTAREAQRALEDALDVCRLALGLLAATPLGEAAEVAELREAYGADPHEAAPVEQGNGHAEPKRGRGRPKGAKNKPRGDAPPPPPIPDDPFPGSAWN